MKRTVYLAFAALFCILVGCSRNEVEPQYATNTIQASVAQVGTPRTKAIMRDNPGVAVNIFWQAGDHIGIFGEGGSNVDFSLSEKSLSNNGRTAVFETTDKTPKGELLAYYPYAANTKESGGSLSFTASATQNYTIIKGVVQPDPAANFMMAKGTRGSGLLFQPLMAILKIGKVFDEDLVINSVQFRDLDNKPVSGALAASFKSGKPVAEYSGSANTITLDCGNYVKAAQGELKVFFLLVPARSYPKGYELTFFAEGGKKITQTVGASMGKTLQSGTVYNVGDLIGYDKIEGVESDIYPEAIVMDENNQENVQIQNKQSHYLEDENGFIIYDNHNRAVTSCNMDLIVSNDLNPKVGGWIIFDEPSDMLPYGGVFRITSCNKTDENHSSISVVPEMDIFAPFKNLKIGEEGDEIPVNLNGFISEVVDKDGNSIDFDFNSDGQLVFGDDALDQMLGTSSKVTKDVVNKWPSKFSLPNFSICAKTPQAEATFTPQLTTEVSTAIGAFDGELQYAVLKINPTLSMKAEFALKLSASAKKDMYLFGLKTTGIPIGGVVVFFEIEVSARVEVGGELVFTTTMSCSQDLGTYAISYNSGDGFNTRTVKKASQAGYNMEDPTMSGTGSVYLKGGVDVAASINLYGLLSLGLATDFLVKGEVKNDYEGLHDRGLVFAITPEMEITPRIAVNCLGIKWAHHFEELTLKFNFDPWYEACLIPAMESDFKINYNETKQYYVFEVPEDVFGFSNLLRYMRTGVSSIEYSASIEGKCTRDFTLGLAIYEVKDYQSQFIGASKECEEQNEILKKLGYPYPYDCSIYVTLPTLSKPVHIESLGEVYKAGTKSKEFSGTVKPNFSFSSNKIYAPFLVLMQNDEVVYTLGLESVLYRNPGNSLMSRFIYYCWPTDLNGHQYVSYDEWLNTHYPDQSN